MIAYIFIQFRGGDMEEIASVHRCYHLPPVIIVPQSLLILGHHRRLHY